MDIEKQPSNEESSSSVSDNDLVEKGKELLSRGQFQEAKQYFENALKITQFSEDHPEFVTPSILVNLGKYKKN